MSTNANASHLNVSLYKRVYQELGNNGGDIPATLAGFGEEFNAQNGDGRLGERLQAMATIRILDLEASLGRARRMAQLVEQWQNQKD